MEVFLLLVLCHVGPVEDQYVAEVEANHFSDGVGGWRCCLIFRDKNGSIMDWRWIEQCKIKQTKSLGYNQQNEWIIEFGFGDGRVQRFRTHHAYSTHSSFDVEAWEHNYVLSRWERRKLRAPWVMPSIK